MNSVIWKYPLNAPEVEIQIPRCAVILTARLQRGEMCLWVQVNPDAPKHRHTFRCINTGDDFDTTGLRYIATDETENGIVWHVYEKERGDDDRH